jgi:transcription initiation factor IIE alpha subunit
MHFCQSSASKLDVIRSMMTRTDGATLDELVSATGWQPHSVRAGMTGLRKQGLTIVRTKNDGTTRFVIETQPVEATA